MSTYRDWIVEQYNSFVLGEVDGSTIEKSRDHLAHHMLDAIETGDLPPVSLDVEWARGVVGAALNPERQKRRGSFKKNAEYLLDALRNPDDGIHVEPFLDTVYPLGSHDGRDKAFRYWTEEDLISSTMERYRNAAAAVEAAKEYDEISQELIVAMRGRSAGTVGQIFEQAVT